MFDEIMKLIWFVVYSIKFTFIFIASATVNEIKKKIA